MVVKHVFIVFQGSSDMVRLLECVTLSYPFQIFAF